MFDKIKQCRWSTLKHKRTQVTNACFCNNSQNVLNMQQYRSIRKQRWLILWLLIYSAINGITFNNKAYKQIASDSGGIYMCTNYTNQYKLKNILSAKQNIT